METGGGSEEGGATRPWTLFPNTWDVDWDGAGEDKTIPLLEGEDDEILKDDPLRGWPGPWNPEETNPFVNETKRPLLDPLATGEVLWDNFVDKEFRLNTPINLSPVAKLSKPKDVLVETQF